MNSKTIVKLSNIIGIVSIIALIYWVFVFISIEVFGFKIFRENMTETFYLSVFGILALMFGALIINIMFNLTRIAEKHNLDNDKLKKSSKKLWILFILSFPFLFALLWGGDFLTKNKKEKMLITSAKSIIENDTTKIDQILNYSYTVDWVRSVDNILDLYSKTDKNLPNVTVIVADMADNSKIFLGFDRNASRGVFSTEDGVKVPDYLGSRIYYYMWRTNQVERDYLNSVFYENNNEIRFSSYNGDYELYYPYRKNGKIIVLYFSQYQRYGKIGS